MKSIRFSSKHQALSAFDWTDIPPFAIIAGLNGVGKTQLLELLTSELSVGAFFSRGSELKLEPRPSAVGCLPTFWQLGDEKVTHDRFFKPVAELARVIEAQLGRINDLDSIVEVIFNSIKSASMLSWGRSLSASWRGSPGEASYSFRSPTPTSWKS